MSAPADAEGQPRRSPGRPRIPLDRIVASAREMVDAEGGGALTMRSLATRLKTSPTVLYRAMTDRAEILDRVVDATLAEIEFDFDPDGNHWMDDARSGALAMFEVLGRHPGVAPLLIQRVPTGPSSVVLRERLLAMLLAHNLSAEDASLAYATLVRFVVGFAAQLTTDTESAEKEAARLTEMYREFDLTQLPATVAVAHILPHQSLESEFRFGLDLMMEGLAAYLRRGL